MPSEPHSSRQRHLDSLQASMVVQDGRAARTVAGRAKDADDCRLLLEMLGLRAGGPAVRHL
jgi:hypothetical protein